MIRFSKPDTRNQHEIGRRSPTLFYHHPYLILFDHRSFDFSRHFRTDHSRPLLFLTFFFQSPTNTFLFLLPGPLRPTKVLRPPNHPLEFELKVPDFLRLNHRVNGRYARPALSREGVSCLGYWKTPRYQMETPKLTNPIRTRLHCSFSSLQTCRIRIGLKITLSMDASALELG